MQSSVSGSLPISHSEVFTQVSWRYLQQYAIMTIAPENKPPVPIPAMALPTMSATLLGAVAQMRELLQNQSQARLLAERDLPKLEQTDSRDEHNFDL